MSRYPTSAEREKIALWEEIREIARKVVEQGGGHIPFVPDYNNPERWAREHKETQNNGEV